MHGPLPVRSRVYRNHHLDSTYWDHIKLRNDDIVISTSLKTGTTWMQRIVSLLILGPGPLPGSLAMLSPWIDSRFWLTAEEMAELAEAQTHRRFFKSHLPLDALPYDSKLKYVYVGRDGRDVFMSFLNHWASYTDVMYERLNGGTDLVGEPLRPCPDDLHAVFRDWVSRGSFSWEQDGYPFWSHLYHARSFWGFRHLPNVFFVHFNELKNGLEGEMRRLAAFLGIDAPESSWPALVDGATFDTMKKEADALIPEFELGFKGGGKAFINKGTNGRWRDVLTPDELAQYEVAVRRSLTPECARWLEHGRAAGDPKKL
jgi:aryl sulfotransferase